MSDKTRQELLSENISLHKKVNDLTTLLEATIGHSDVLEADLLQKIDDTIKESEKQFRLITETLPITTLITVQSDGSIIYANNAASSLFGLSVSELTGRKATDFYNVSDRVEILDEFVQQGFVKNKELKGHDAQGNSWWVELSIKSIEFDGKPCFLSIFHDITNRKMLEAQLQQSQKLEAIGTLAGGIAHDFNNILMAIFGYTELSLSLSAKGSALQAHLQNVLMACERAKNLVHQILAFSRQTEQEFRPVDLKTTVKEALKLLRASLPTTIHMKRNIQSESLVMGDPTQIHQILMNLCTNAGYALNKSGGEISVELTDVLIDATFAAGHPDLHPGPYVKLVVTDTGQGIPPENISRIFEPFFTTKEKGRGSGLGLSVVHGIVKKHQGIILVDSEPGKGSTFSVYLPVTKKRLPFIPLASVSDYLGSEHILFVDDDHTVVKIGEEILGAKGYRVTPATGSLDALALFHLNPNQFDLLITDLVMPNMTGDHLAYKIMSERPDLPVIICTAGDTFIHQEELLAAGVRAIVMKPFTISALCKTIREVLDAVK